MTQAPRDLIARYLIGTVKCLLIMPWGCGSIRTGDVKSKHGKNRFFVVKNDSVFLYRSDIKRGGLI